MSKNFQAFGWTTTSTVSLLWIQLMEPLKLSAGPVLYHSQCHIWRTLAYIPSFIAITGLAGRAFASWQNLAGQMWLRDFLPPRFSDCRFFTYGYPSKARQSLSQASVASFREQFVREIAYLRSKAEVTHCTHSKSNTEFSETWAGLSDPSDTHRP